MFFVCTTTLFLPEKMGYFFTNSEAWCSLSLQIIFGLECCLMDQIWRSPLPSTIMVLKLYNIFRSCGVSACILILLQFFIMSASPYILGCMISKSLFLRMRMYTVEYKGSNSKSFMALSFLNSSLRAFSLICLELKHGPIAQVFKRIVINKLNQQNLLTRPHLQFQYINQVGRMSITIRTDQLNLLIYKYLLESNLSHTAFTLFSEARLEPSISQYKFDLKAGHLVSLLEKALIFNQIESHITINDYEECQEPFYLLKSHICRITEKAKEDKDKILQEMNEQIYSTMRRVSSIHNAQVPNKQYEQIIYDHRSPYFFDRSAIKFSGAGKIEDFALIGNSQYLCAKTGDSVSTCLNIMEYSENTNDFSLTKVLPCCSIDKNLKIDAFQIIPASQILIRVFEGNLCEVNSLKNEETGIFFGVPLSSPVIKIKQNPKFGKLVTFVSESEYCIIYFGQSEQKCLKLGKGKFSWINSHQFFVTNDKYIIKSSLKNLDQETLFVSPIASIQEIRLSESEIYFSAESIAEGIVCIYTFEKDQPLYIFDYSNKLPNGVPGSQVMEGEQGNQNTPLSNTSEQESLKQVGWCNINSADSLIILTDSAIKAFEIQLNNYSKIIEISSYDKEVFSFALLQKNQSEDHYVICIGLQNLIVCDMGLSKIERIQCQPEGEEKPRKDLVTYEIEGKQLLGLKMNGHVYILKNSDFEPLFA